MPRGATRGRASCFPNLPAASRPDARCGHGAPGSRGRLEPPRKLGMAGTRSNPTRRRKHASSLSSWQFFLIEWGWFLSFTFEDQEQRNKNRMQAKATYLFLKFLVSSSQLKNKMKQYKKNPLIFCLIHHIQNIIVSTCNFSTVRYFLNFWHCLQSPVFYCVDSNLYERHLVCTRIS